MQIDEQGNKWQGRQMDWGITVYLVINRDRKSNEIQTVAFSRKDKQVLNKQRIKKKPFVHLILPVRVNKVTVLS